MSASPRIRRNDSGTAVVAIPAGPPAGTPGGRRDRTPPGPPSFGVVVFVLTVVKAATGGRSTLWVHVPGAMVLTVGAVWLRSGRSARSPVAENG
jgi:hypothetical protein